MAKKRVGVKTHTRKTSNGSRGNGKSKTTIGRTVRKKK